MRIAILPLFIALIVSHVGLINHPLYAQASSVDTYVQADTAQAYWRLLADQYHATPTVQFFNRHHQLLYQEQLPESSPKMTRRMKRAFDVLLTNLTANRILATAYLSQPDIFRFTEPTSTSTNFLPLRQVIYKKGIALLDVQPSINQIGRLTVHFAQAKHRLMGIRLDNDDRNVTYFDDCSKLSLYHRNLNVSQLASGVYHLTIHGYSNSVSYQLTIDRALNRYYLQKEPETNLQSLAVN
jgi:hypothetical protein